MPEASLRFACLSYSTWNPVNIPPVGDFGACQLRRLWTFPIDHVNCKWRNSHQIKAFQGFRHLSLSLSVALFFSPMFTDTFCFSIQDRFEISFRGFYISLIYILRWRVWLSVKYSLFSFFLSFKKQQLKNNNNKQVLYTDRIHVQCSLLRNTINIYLLSLNPFY